MNLSTKERHAKRRKRNILAKNLRESKQYHLKVVPNKKNEYNRQEWKNETEVESI